MITLIPKLIKTNGFKLIKFKRRQENRITNEIYTKEKGLDTSFHYVL